MKPRFKAWLQDCGVMTDVVQLEWNQEGVTWVTLFDAVPRTSYHAYGGGKTKRVPANRVELILIDETKGKRSYETDTK
jgi:hypothetical protein